MNAPIQLLLVEDNETDVEIVRLVLSRSPELNISINQVPTLRDAVAATHDRHYDVAILDLGLPDSAGLEAVSRLKAAAPSTPIVVLTGQDDGDTAAQAIRYGAQEYLSKDHLMGHVLTRVIRHSMARQQQLFDAQAQALTDALTSVGNRRAFELEFERQVADWNRQGTPFCAALLDVDYFKRVNDTWGHDVGDQVLRSVASMLTQVVRTIDVVARYGGEEFAVILPATRLVEAFRVADRVRSVIATSCGSDLRHDLKVTVSGGVAEIVDGDDCQSLLQRADEALYAAKQQGRNRFLLHDGASIQDAVSAGNSATAV